MEDKKYLLQICFEIFKNIKMLFQKVIKFNAERVTYKNDSLFDNWLQRYEKLCTTDISRIRIGGKCFNS